MEPLTKIQLSELLYAKREDMSVVNSAMEYLDKIYHKYNVTERQRNIKIFYLNVIEEYSCAELGRLFDVSSMRVRTIVAIGILTLRHREFLESLR